MSIIYHWPGGDVKYREKRRLVEHRIKEDDYFIKKRILEDVKFMRSKKQIRAFERKLEEAAVLKARQDIQAKFPKPAKIPQNSPFGGKP